MEQVISGPGLRQRLDRPSPLVVPGVHDTISAHLVQRAGFEAVYLTRVAQCLSHLGHVGSASSTEAAMIERARYVAAAVDIPIIAEARLLDGTRADLRRAVQLYQQAGVSAIQLDDSIESTSNDNRYFNSTEVEKTLSLAAEARWSDDLLLIPRVSAVPAGTAEWVKRIQRYHRAGADVILMDRVTDLVDNPALVDQLGGVPLAVLASATALANGPTAVELTEIGVQMVIMPMVTLESTVRATGDVLREIRRWPGTSSASAPYAEDIAPLSLRAVRHLDDHSWDLVDGLDDSC